MTMRCLVVILLACAVPVAAAPMSEDAAHLERIAKRDQVDLAIAKALSWLAGQQDPATGVFGPPQPLPNTFTALSCMAMLAAGEQPGRTTYGEHLRKGVLHLIRAARKGNGYFGEEGNGRMYTQGIATLALAEAYGQMALPEDNRRVREALDLALKVILAAQSRTEGQNKGGWRYAPQPGDADLSVSAWQVLVLRSAQNCRLEVPEEAVKEAMAYVRRMYCPQVQAFTYQGQAGYNTPAMNSAGVVAMLCLGLSTEAEDQEKCRNSAKILLTCDPSGGGHYWYQTYYLATAANMMGGAWRDTLVPKLEKAVLAKQNPAGDFQQTGDAHGGVYATAFAVIALAVRWQYLPIYQE